MHVILCLLLFIGILYQYNKFKSAIPIKFSSFEIFYGLIISFETIINSFILYKEYSTQMENAISIPEYFINGSPVSFTPDLKPAMFFIILSCILVIIYFIILLLRYLKSKKLEIN
ncbi:MAG: hypothetical protein ACRDAU_02015 [Clostridium sp.]